VPKQFLIGYATPHQAILTVVAAVLAVALAFGLRAPTRPVGARGVAVGVPWRWRWSASTTDHAKPDRGDGAPGGARRHRPARSPAGPALVGALCAVGVIAYAGVEGNRFYQRDDWRDAAAALGPATRGPRVIVVNPPTGAGRSTSTCLCTNCRPGCPRRRARST